MTDTDTDTTALGVARPGSLTRTRLVTRTRDTAVAHTAIQQTSAVRGLDVTGGGDFLFEETLTGTPLLTLESPSCTGSVRGEVDPADGVVVVWLKSGHAVVDGQQLPVGRPVVHAPGRQRVQWDRFQKDVMRIDREVVELVAADRGGWEPGPLEFEPNHVPEGAPLAAWWLMVRSVAAEILGTTGEVPLEREVELARTAAAGLLTAIPHWPVGRSTERPPHAALARAETYLLEHVAERVTVDDVAAAAGTSQRGLQSAIQRIHGTTPMTYLRSVRLLMARQQLESGEAGSVAEVARSVGIAHLGRFSGGYRDAFGELPVETLRAAREQWG
jgi:AraC-like DNA-binding protein